MPLAGCTTSWRSDRFFSASRLLAETTARLTVWSDRGTATSGLRSNVACSEPEREIRPNAAGQQECISVKLPHIRKGQSESPVVNRLAHITSKTDLLSHGDNVLEFVVECASACRPLGYEKNLTIPTMMGQTQLSCAFVVWAEISFR